MGSSFTLSAFSALGKGGKTREAEGATAGEVLAADRARCEAELKKVGGNERREKRETGGE
jgi:hypothetical protein